MTVLCCNDRCRCMSDHICSVRDADCEDREDPRGVVAATDGRDGAPGASAATTPGGAPSRLEPGTLHTSINAVRGAAKLRTLDGLVGGN